MSEKVKVPKWFDEWYKSFDNIIRENNDKRLYYISRIGFGFLLHDGDDKEMSYECSEYAGKNSEKLIRAILDGYEVEPEYIEVSPVNAYERYLNDKDVYVSVNDNNHPCKIKVVSPFSKKEISALDTKFYIKKEN
jgi:hypothetical protein